MTTNNPFLDLDGISNDELTYLNHIIIGMEENQLRSFYQIYSSRRKKSQEILLFTLLGFLGFAGIQRFILGQVAMGVIYFFTAGFCFIGTIVDVINHRSVTDEYNRKVAKEVAQLVQ